MGSKDANRSLFSVWESLFFIPRPDKVNATPENAGGEVGNSVPVRYRNVLGMVQSCGEYDRLVAGVFENYLTVKFKDNGLRNVVNGLDWLAHFDILNKEAMKSQTWALMGHFSFPLVACHLLFASNMKQRIGFPTQNSEATAKLQRSWQMMESVQNEMEVSSRPYCNNTVLLREVLPTILSVIQPTLRPVNTQLFSAKEKAELANVVSVHIAYSISYQQERNQETGQYQYRMEPDIESLVWFPETKRASSLSYGSKQLISHQIELEKMRRIDAAKAEFASEKNISQKKVETPAEIMTPKGSKKTSNHLATLTAKPVDIKPVVATDFFGRVIKVDPTMQLKKSEGDLVKSDIWFKFKEGYSNAVRRNVKIKNFL